MLVIAVALSSDDPQAGDEAETFDHVGYSAQVVIGSRGRVSAYAVEDGELFAPAQPCGVNGFLDRERRSCQWK